MGRIFTQGAPSLKQGVRGKCNSGTKTFSAKEGGKFYAESFFPLIFPTDGRRYGTFHGLFNQFRTLRVFAKRDLEQNSFASWGNGCSAACAQAASWQNGCEPVSRQVPRRGTQHSRCRAHAIPISFTKEHNGKVFQFVFLAWSDISIWELGGWGASSNNGTVFHLGVRKRTPSVHYIPAWCM